MSKNNHSDDDSAQAGVAVDSDIIDPEIYTVNDSNEKTKLLNEEKQLGKIYNSEKEARTSSQESSSGKNRFGFSTSRSCPTCNGTGKVKKNEQDKLVALIPLSDNRLKPKRIWLWILSTFIVCLIIATTLTFLLAPRVISVSSSQSDLHPYNITNIYTPDNVTIGKNIFFEEIYEIYNANFFEVKMINLTLELNRISHLVAPQITYVKDLPLKPREKTNVSVSVKYIMYSETDPYVDLCDRGVINELFALVTTTFQFSTLWSKDVEAQVKATQYLYCRYTNLTIPHKKIAKFV